ncbi:MAG: hypothetical protein FWF40_04060, partial [Methanomassiliicoccaceae archaeon]|nr:hypothetical protein [Methanomassiliicoccaceae archaeon]
MFESLKNKLKSLFKRDKTHAEPEPGPEHIDEVTENVPGGETAPVNEVQTHAEPQLSRKERAKLAKQEKIAAKEKARGNTELVGDSGKRIKEGNLDEVLWEL